MSGSLQRLLRPIGRALGFRRSVGRVAPSRFGHGGSFWLLLSRRRGVRRLMVIGVTVVAVLVAIADESVVGGGSRYTADAVAAGKAISANAATVTDAGADAGRGAVASSSTGAGSSLSAALVAQAGPVFAPSGAQSNDVLPNDHAWEAANVIDADPATVYSSNFFAGSVNDRSTFLAEWLLAGPSQVNELVLTARMYNGVPNGFPASYDVYVTTPDNSDWQHVGQFANQPDGTGLARVRLPQLYSTHGVMIIPNVLGVDIFGNHYFQIAEVRLALDTSSRLASNLWMGDYDGDGRTDFASWWFGNGGASTYNPRETPQFSSENGSWGILFSATNSRAEYAPDLLAGTYPWNVGQPGDIPVPGDYDGDHITDRAVWDPRLSTWTVALSSVRLSAWPSIYAVYATLGGVNSNGVRDVPVVGDYDGDGRSDVAVWGPVDGVWRILSSSDGGLRTVQWGLLGDVPVPGDYDGDGKTDLAIFRPSDGTWWTIDSSTGQAEADVKQWGLTGDLAVPGDFDGDGKTDRAVFRPATSTWYVANSSNGQSWNQSYGGRGDFPMTGDWDGDGRTDLAVATDNSVTGKPVDTEGDRSARVLLSSNAQTITHTTTPSTSDFAWYGGPMLPLTPGRYGNASTTLAIHQSTNVNDQVRFALTGGLRVTIDGDITSDSYSMLVTDPYFGDTITSASSQPDITIGPGPGTAAQPDTRTICLDTDLASFTQSDPVFFVPKPSTFDKLRALVTGSYYVSRTNFEPQIMKVSTIELNLLPPKTSGYPGYEDLSAALPRAASEYNGLHVTGLPPMNVTRGPGGGPTAIHSIDISCSEEMDNSGSAIARARAFGDKRRIDMACTTMVKEAKEFNVDTDYYIRSILEHEVGHELGLAHKASERNSTNLMDPSSHATVNAARNNQDTFDVLKKIGPILSDLYDKNKHVLWTNASCEDTNGNVLFDLTAQGTPYSPPHPPYYPDHQIEWGFCWWIGPRSYETANGKYGTIPGYYYCLRG